MEAGPLLRQALSPANLLTAWSRVAANRGMAGVDGETIDGIAPQVHGVLDEIAAGVWAGSYRPAALRRVWMARPGKPPRGLAVPTVRDRILQTPMTLVLTPPEKPGDYTLSFSMATLKGEEYVTFAESSSRVVMAFWEATVTGVLSSARSSSSRAFASWAARGRQAMQMGAPNSQGLCDMVSSGRCPTHRWRPEDG